MWEHVHLLEEKKKFMVVIFCEPCHKNNLALNPWSEPQSLFFSFTEHHQVNIVKQFFSFKQTIRTRSYKNRSHKGRDSKSEPSHSVILSIFSSHLWKNSGCDPLVIYQREKKGEDETNWWGLYYVVQGTTRQLWVTLCARDWSYPIAKREKSIREKTEDSEPQGFHLSAKQVWRNLFLIRPQDIMSLLVLVIPLSCDHSVCGTKYFSLPLWCQKRDRVSHTKKGASIYFFWEIFMILSSCKPFF
jgi:hypothetical protein